MVTPRRAASRCWTSGSPRSRPPNSNPEPHEHADGEPRGPDRRGPGLRHGGLHVAGADAGRASRRAVGRLLPRRRALPDGDRRASVPGRERGGPDLLDPARHAASRRGPARRPSAAPVEDPAPLPREGAARPLPDLARRVQRAARSCGAETSSARRAPAVRPPSGAVPPARSASSSPRARVFGIAAAAIVLAIAAVWIARSRTGTRSRAPEAAAPPPAIRSLAVLPLDNYSGDPSQDYFAEGMTDELTSELANISQLRVISRGSAMQFKGKDRPPTPEIAKKLDVDAIVEGSVLRSGRQGPHHRPADRRAVGPAPLVEELRAQLAATCWRCRTSSRRRSRARFTSS